jgi:hypothetical protein
MARWNSVRTLGGFVLASVAAWAWLAGAGRSPADTPPKPATDRLAEVEKRLLSVEEKLDRALKLLEGRTASAPAAAADVPRLVKVRDEAQQALAKQEAMYTDFRKRSPAGLFRLGNGLNVYSERLAMIEKRRSELDLSQIVLTSRLSAYEKALKKGVLAPQDILSVMQRAGVDVNAVQRAKPNVSDRELLDTIIQSLRADIADNVAMVQDLDAKFIKGQREAQELQNYEAQEEMLRKAADKLKAELDSITEQLLRAAGLSSEKK